MVNASCDIGEFVAHVGQKVLDWFARSGDLVSFIRAGVSAAPLSNQSSCYCQHNNRSSSDQNAPGYPPDDLVYPPHVNRLHGADHHRRFSKASFVPLNASRCSSVKPSTATRSSSASSTISACTMTLNRRSNRLAACLWASLLRHYFPSYSFHQNLECLRDPNQCEERSSLFLCSI